MGQPEKQKDEAVLLVDPPDHIQRSSSDRC